MGNAFSALMLVIVIKITSLLNHSIGDWMHRGVCILNINRVAQWVQGSSEIFSFLIWTFSKPNSSVDRALVWPQWWSFADVSQRGLDFSKKISKRKKKLIWLSQMFTWVVKKCLNLTFKVNFLCQKSFDYFHFTDFFAKIYSLLTHVRKTPTLRSHYHTYLAL